MSAARRWNGSGFLCSVPQPFSHVRARGFWRWRRQWCPITNFSSKLRGLHLRGCSWRGFAVANTPILLWRHPPLVVDVESARGNRGGLHRDCVLRWFACGVCTLLKNAPCRPQSREPGVLCRSHICDVCNVDMLSSAAIGFVGREKLALGLRCLVPSMGSRSRIPEPPFCSLVCALGIAVHDVHNGVACASLQSLVMRCGRMSTQLNGILTPIR